MKLPKFLALYFGCAVLLLTAPGRSQDGGSQGSASTSPLLRFGLLADVQYADKASAGKRAYRQALDNMKACATELKKEKLAFVLQLGDIIDGTGNEQDSMRDLERVLTAMESIGAPMRHVVGNHCFSVPREKLLERLGLGPAYYSFRAAGWRFIQLDTLDISVCGRMASCPEHALATQWLKDLRANGSKNAQSWNGGVGKLQLSWLAKELRAAEKAGESVLVCGHLPLLPAASNASLVLWNGAEVMALLEAAPTVAAYFSGHDHAGGYALHNGIHHLTVPGMLEAPPDKNAWAIVEVHKTHLQVNGHGTVSSRRIERNVPSTKK